MRLHKLDEILLSCEKQPVRKCCCHSCRSRTVLRQIVLHTPLCYYCGSCMFRLVLVGRPSAAMPGKAVDHSAVADWRLPDEEFLEAFQLPGPDERCTALQEANPLGPEKIVSASRSIHAHLDRVCKSA